MGPRYLEPPQGRSACKRGCGDCAEGNHEPEESNHHWPIPFASSVYQVLLLDSGATLILLAAFVSSNTRKPT
jgi:hypothetical protein